MSRIVKFYLITWGIGFSVKSLKGFNLNGPG